MNLRIIPVFFIALAVFGTAVFAQETDAVSCFDYYRFGSVQADITSQIATTSAGSPMHFNVKITNTNNYPVVGGSVFVKIFRKENDPEKAHGQGHHVAGQFFAAENISLAESAEREISFDWNVPLNSIPGRYQAVTFFATEKKFNLLGLTFTDDIVGNRFEFDVKSESQGGVSFLKDSVKISDANGNDFNYNFAAFTPKMHKDSPVLIESELSNTTTGRQDVEIEWRLYSWDFLSEDNLIESKKEQVSINPGEKLKLFYGVRDSKFPVYLLVARAAYKDSNSILNIRFVREGVDRPRLNFPSILKFPLRQQEANSIFACMHNSGTNELVQNARFEAELSDANGAVIHRYAKDLNISGSMMALKTDFAPESYSEKFTLKANLYMNGNIVDSSTTEYDCQKIYGAQCAVSKPSKNVPQSGQDLVSTIIFAAAVIVLLVSGFLYFKKKTKGILHSFLLALVIGSMFLMAPDVQAKSDQWNQAQNASLYYYWDRFGVNWRSIEQWEAGLANPNVTISYEVQIKDKTTGTVIAENSNVAVGTILVFEALPFEDTDISWVGTGYSSDSPYGHWGNPNTAPAVECKTNDFVNRATTYGIPLDVYIPLIISPPLVEIIHSSAPGSATLLCGAVSAGKQECTVTAPGNINSTFKFGATNGKFYYRYYDFRDEDVKGFGHLYPGCYGNANPLRINQYTTQWSGYCDWILNCVDTFEYFRMKFREDYSYDFATGQYCDWTGWNCVSSSEYFWLPSKYSYTYETFVIDHVQDFPYVLSVPEKTISYNFSVTDPNNKPTAPIITGPTNGLTDTIYTYTFRSTDPDGDPIRYGVDRDGDNVVNEWLPASGYVASGTEVSGTLRWFAPGAKSFKVLAQDSKSGNSEWSPYSVTIKAPLTADAGPAYSSFVNTPFNLQGAAAGGSGTYNTWSWTFGANNANCSVVNQANTLRPGINCAQPGSTQVNLTVTDSDNETASDNSTITIIPVPTCTATASKTDAKTNEAVEITVDYSNFSENPLASENPDNVICGPGNVRYVKQLNCLPNGNTAPFSGTCTATCTYNSQGPYTPSVTIKSTGQSASCLTARVNITYPALEAKINGPYNATINQALKLVNTTVTGGSGTYSEYKWEFPANPANCSVTANSNTANPDVLCTTGATSEVKLTVKDSAGSESSDTDRIISAPPVPNRPPVCNIFAFYDQDSKALDVQFTVTSRDTDGTIASNRIDFGNGSSQNLGTNTTEIINKNYLSSPGNGFTATSAITDDDGDSSTCSRDITFNPCNGVCETGPVCASRVSGRGVCTGTQICCKAIPKEKNSVSIDVTVSREKFKVGQEPEIDASFRAIRYDNAVLNADYQIKIKKNAEQYALIKSGNVTFARNEAVITLTPEERAKLELTPSGSVGPGVYTITAVILDTFPGETIKHDNIDSETVLVWEYRKPVAEISPLLAVLVAALIIGIITKS